jgi:hypothetical protein
VKRRCKVIDIRTLLVARRNAEEFLKGKTFVPFPVHLYEPPEGWALEVRPRIERIKKLWEAHVDAVIEYQKKQSGHKSGHEID